MTRFRVAFSFSSDVRKYVSEVANALTIAFPQEEILYDHFHEAEFSRADLGIYLPELYNKETDLIVLILSERYEEVEWCGLEFRAVHDLIAKRYDEKIMLCRFKLADVTGIYRAGYIELDKKDPVEFAKLIVTRYRRIAHAQSVHDGKAGDVARVQRKHNLPALGFFAGRKQYQKDILDALNPEVRTWGAVIYGQGGIGKTSLAITAAHSTRNFDQVIFLSAQKYRLTSEGVTSLEDSTIPNFLKLLSELLRQLGAGNVCRLNAEKRKRKALEELSGKKILLVADNIESFDAQNRNSLLNFLRVLPNGCKAIVTTRERLIAEATLIELKALSNEEAGSVLRHYAEFSDLISSMNEADGKLLISKTAGNPMLLCWALGQIGQGSCRSAEDAIVALEAGLGTNKPLSFIYGSVVARLGELERHIAALLTLFDQPVNVEIIADVLNKGTETIQLALSVLANEMIISYSDKEENVILNYLALVHFLQADKDYIEGVKLEVSAIAENLLSENGRERHEQFPVLDRKWPIISCSVVVFSTFENKRLQRVCEDSKTFFNFTGRWDERLGLSLAAEATAAAAGDRLSAGWRAYDAGMVHYRRAEWRETIEASDRVESYFANLYAGQGGIALSHRLKGLAYRGMGKLDRAIEFGKSSVDLWRSEIEGKDLACALNALAVSQTLAHDFDNARMNYSEALNIAARVDAQEYFADYSGNTADIPILQENWEEACEIVLKALPLTEKLGRRELIARNCLRMAKIETGLNNLDSAFNFATRAKRIYTSITMPQSVEAERLLRNLSL